MPRYRDDPGPLGGSSARAGSDSIHLLRRLDSGRLWSWAFDPLAPRRMTITLTRGKPSAMRLRAAMLGSGTVVPAGAGAADLPSVARVLHREIRDYGD